MDAKKGKTRKESTPIKVWVTPQEKAAIAAKADAHSLSASSYLRRLGLAMPLQSMIDQRAILDLVKINADLGRFGGLIKMWLTTNADLNQSARREPQQAPQLFSWIQIALVSAICPPDAPLLYTAHRVGGCFRIRNPIYPDACQHSPTAKQSAVGCN